MGKQTKRKHTEARKPEDDRNNVAFYKKKTDTNSKNEDIEHHKVITEQQEEKTREVDEGKTWSQVAGRNVKNVERRAEMSAKRTTKISPEFKRNQTGYDRIVVTPTHFNKKQFKGFISDEEAVIISNAIGLATLNNHHGTSFYRSENDVLYITYKLKRNLSQQEIADSVNKYFWFDKESKVGNLDQISGQVVHPPMGADSDDDEEESVGQHVYQPAQVDDTKEVKIDGCNYEISEPEIRRWIELYGEIKSEIKEVAIPGDKEEGPVGTGSYMVQVKLNRSIPHILPINGLKVKFTYNGVKKQCKNCYEYHKERRTGDQTNKKTYSCEKRTYDQYVEIFKENNPRIMKSIMEHRNEVASGESDESTDDYNDDENTPEINIHYSFNYDINLS
jgi:hypothetical protein